MDQQRPMVREFRQILLWPVQLSPQSGADASMRHAERLARLASQWEEASDTFAGDGSGFEERHYAEFAAFMPAVQRFLYGESDQPRAGASYGASPVRIFRRRDVATVRAQFQPESAPVDFTVVRAALYFFYDIDLAIITTELLCHDLTLDQAQEALFRLGRVYPTTWEADGSGTNCCASISLLDAAGAVLAVSDYAHKTRYLDFVRAHRTPRIASHWQYLMHPLAPEHEQATDGREPIRFRPLEHQRLPVFGCLAVDHPLAISREDWMRLALVAPSGPGGVAPFAPGFLADFEARYCYDRFWEPAGGHNQIATRILCSGQAFIMVGDAADPRYADPATGITCQFRRQYFLLGLIAHFHRAALLIFRDRLVTAISGLTDYAPETVKRFKRAVRLTHENFLRFGHRYWFQEVSNQAPAHDLFAMWGRHLELNGLFAEVRREVLDMIDYLDSDSFRRQANTVVRLTVVTFFGLIGSLTVGFIGAGLVSVSGRGALEKVFHVLAVIIPVTALILYTAKKSHRLAEFLDAISDERRTFSHKARAFLRIWRRSSDRPPRG